MRFCCDCQFRVSASVCAAPQLIDLARLVDGVPRPGVTMPALQMRLNQATCGSPGYWFVEKPPAPPETKELPASAT